MATDGVSRLQVVVEGKDETTRVLKGIESGIIRFVGAVSAALATLNVVVFPVKAAATFQKELLNVGKTTDFTDSQLSQLADGLKTLSYRLNVSADDLAKIAAAGGQMGLGSEGVDGILAFTEAASRLSSVLDISADESGNALGRLTNIFKIGIKDAEKISSLLNEVSNKSTADGRDLIDMIQRIGTAGGTLGIKQAAALAATGRDLGLTVETVGTSFNKIFLDLQTKATEIAPILGLPVEEFARIARDDGIGALQMWIAALNKMGSVQRAVLSEQVTGGGRIFALMTSLGKDGASGYEVLARNVRAANEGYDEGTSALREQERVLTGLLAQGQVLQNVFIGVGEAVGRRALPYITQLVRKLQEWAKDPEVTESFDRFATFIGHAADAVIVLVQQVASLSVVMGPLLRFLQVYIALKIVGSVVSTTASLIRQAKAATDAAKAWYMLLTANKQTVQAMAASAREINANNAAAANSGKAAQSVSGAGRIATYLDTALAEKFAVQDRLTGLTAQQAAAEQLLVERTNQRAKVLTQVRAEMDKITSSAKTQAQAAYDAVINAGGTKKAARAAQNDVKASLNRAVLDLKVASSNLEVAYSDSIDRRSSNLKSISTQAAQTKKTLEGLGTAGIVFASLRTTITGAAAAVGTFLTRLLAVGGAVAGVIGLVAFFLDLFGVLDPVIAGMKKILGISDAAATERRRQEQERQTAWAKELRQSDEMLKAYELQKKAKADADKAGISTGVKDQAVLNSSLAAQAEKLRVINGAYLSLSAKGVEIAGSLDFVKLRWEEINKQLAEAKRQYDAVAKKKLEQDVTGTSPYPLSFKVSDTDVKAAKAKVDELASSLDLLGKARGRFEQDATANSQRLEEVTAAAIAQAEQLAPLYDASGLAALRSFEKVLDAQQKLAEATKLRDELAKAGNAPDAADTDKEKYITAAENVRILEQSLSVLTTSYDELRLSSANATVFMANAFPDAAAASIDKVQSLIRILGGVGDGMNTAMEDTKKGLASQAKEIDEQLAAIERNRKSRIMSLASSRMTMNSLKDATNVVNAEAARKSAPLNTQLGNVRAQQQAMELQAKEAEALAAAYNKVDAAQRSTADSGRGLISNFASTAALKALTNQQIAAQRRVEEGAKFNAENIKRLYEEAKGNLASVVADSKRELGSLGQYFNSRNLTLKLATFDSNQSQGNEQYKKFQDSVLESERKRLEAQGLSSERINEQISMLQEMFAWTDKIRQSQQDEARQRLVINELQTQIKDEQQAIAEASRLAAEYAEKARIAQAGGNSQAAAEFATSAAVEAEKAKLATEGLTEKVREFKAEAAKPVVDSGGARFLVSDAEVKSVVESSAKARVEAAQAVEQATAQAAGATEKWATDQTAALTVLQEKAATYQQTLDAIAKLAPQLAGMQEGLAAAVLSKTTGVSDLADDLQSIANTDFRGLDQFATLSEQSKQVSAMEGSIKEVARTYAESVVPAGQAIAKVAADVETSLKAMGDGGNVAFAKMQTAIASTALSGRVDFPGAAAALQAQLKDKTFTANVEFAGTGQAQQHAEGGYIRGPGTGTSDSFLSWLSNGEYVNDAQTTAFFGPSFFSTLKTIARGGRSALSSFATKMAGGVSLPAFAGGGYIGAPVLSASGGAVGLLSEGKGGVIDRVAVDLNAGGDTVSLLGERREVDKLVKALHRMNRG